jgi:hypothetical protein
LTDLTKGVPAEFKEFMEYCRKLEFTEEPNYKHCIGLFDQCMKKNEFDPKVMDYTWKEDSLKRAKALLKAEMMKTLNGKKKEETKG